MVFLSDQEGLITSFFLIRNTNTKASPNPKPDPNPIPNP